MPMRGTINLYRNCGTSYKGLWSVIFCVLLSLKWQGDWTNSSFRSLIRIHVVLKNQVETDKAYFVSRLYLAEKEKGKKYWQFMFLCKFSKCLKMSEIVLLYQKVSFRHPKDELSHGEYWPFAMRKFRFCLSDCEIVLQSWASLLRWRLVNGMLPYNQCCCIAYFRWVQSNAL